MSRTRLVPATLDHLAELGQVANGWMTMSTGLTLLTTLLKYPAFSLLAEEGVVGAGGIVPVWQGVGEGWALVHHERVRRHLRAFQRSAKLLRDIIIDANNLHRVQANVVASFDAGRRWAEAMGLREEGYVYHGGPNREDLVRYAYVRT